MKANDGDIIWQSKMYSSENTIYFERARKIVLFDNINMTLDSNKVYAIKIDVPMGCVGCCLIDEGKRDRSRTWFINSNGHLRDNEYKMKDDRDGKLYEIVFE